MAFNIPLGEAPFLADQFSGLFEDSGATGLIDLMQLQMQMARNSSEKLDLIKKQLDIVVDSLLSLDKKVDALPARTVASIYKVDIQGRMLDLDELIDAYHSESRSGSRASMKQLVEFIGRTYVEFRSARNRLFYLFPDAPKDEDTLVVPITALCLHYEMICLAVTGQPASLRRITRESYAAYFQKWLTGTGRLEELLVNSISAVREVEVGLRKIPFYTACKDESFFPGEPGIPAYKMFGINLRRFQPVLQARPDDPDVKAAAGLLERGLLLSSDLPSDFTLQAVGRVKIYNFQLPANAAEKEILESPITLDDGTTLPALVRSLTLADHCPPEPDTRMPSTVDLKIIQSDRDEKSRRLVCIAAMTDIARLSVRVLSKSVVADSSRQALSPFGSEAGYIFDLLGERSRSWQELLTQEAVKADAEKRQKLEAINVDWLALQINAKRIMAEYAAIETRVREEASTDLLERAGQLLDPIRRAAEDALAEVEALHRRVIHDIEWNVRKAIEDTSAEAERSLVNLEVAIAASFDFIEAEAGNMLRTLDKVAKAARQGRIVDAVWELTLGKLQRTQDNLADAVFKSSLLKDIAMSAASIYGGPVGTAAFTAWYTYRATGGDLDAALRAGVIAGISSAGMGLSKTIPYTELTRRTLATAVVGAAAVAAAGGSEQDIIRGFLTGTAFTLASAYYAQVVEREMDGRVATRQAIDKFDLKHQEYYGVFTDKDGIPVLDFDEKSQQFYPRIDTNGIPAQIAQVGIAWRGDMNGLAAELFSENAVPMRFLANGVPMMNAMAAFHDRMSDILNLQSPGIVAVTILPASILTVSASQTPLQTLILSTLNSRDKPAAKRDKDGFIVVDPATNDAVPIRRPPK
ncbi:hypothetical protein SAMN03097694_2388 [Janthinobacterium lividum]|uniref:Uncharacterized protein n=1 Tax=Janthinobacterium lividum TaxID=29581 RepID=A0AB38CAA2_9BURK|nr:hypothetical protein [Janthinobacterium lividum]SFX47786.1 hypothetical protein SAMN03097694_2388 [Janthinobacterium lividum]